MAANLLRRLPHSCSWVMTGSMFQMVAFGAGVVSVDNGR